MGLEMCLHTAWKTARKQRRIDESEDPAPQFIADLIQMQIFNLKLTIQRDMTQKGAEADPGLGRGSADRRAPESRHYRAEQTSDGFSS